MSFQDAIADGCTGSFFQYQRLPCLQDKGAGTRPRWRWLRALNGKAASFGFCPTKKLKLSRIVSALLPRRLVEFSSKISRATDVCPTIVFSSQWGLPVLSHQFLSCKKRKYHPYGKAF